MLNGRRTVGWFKSKEQQNDISWRMLKFHRRSFHTKYCLFSYYCSVWVFVLCQLERLKHNWLGFKNLTKIWCTLITSTRKLVEVIKAVFVQLNHCFRQFLLKKLNYISCNKWLISFILRTYLTYILLVGPGCFL